MAADRGTEAINFTIPVPDGVKLPDDWESNPYSIFAQLDLKPQIMVSRHVFAPGSPMRYKRQSRRGKKYKWLYEGARWPF